MHLHQSAYNQDKHEAADPVVQQEKALQGQARNRFVGRMGRNPHSPPFLEVSL
jgi:hypothetical protein